MSAHQQAKQRVHTHRGVDFICVPGSTRERVLLDLFQAEDRAAQRPLSDVVLSESDDGTWSFIIPLWVGIAVGVASVLVIQWWIT